MGLGGTDSEGLLGEEGQGWTEIEQGDGSFEMLRQAQRGQRV